MSAALAARAGATNLPLAAERPPSNISLPRRLAQQTRYHRARAFSIAPAVALLPLGGVPYYHQHIFITAKPARGTIARQYTRIELLPSPTNADAWVGQPSGDLPRTAV